MRNAIKINFKQIIILLFSVLSTKYSFSQYLEFVENKGQWADNITYKGEITTGAIALKPDGGYRMLQHNQNDLKAIHQYLHPEGKGVAAKPTASTNLGLHSHVYEVSFLGCNPTPTAIAEKPQDTYNNYFIGNDKTKWSSGCKIFQAITYKNIYPNIDVRYYTGNGTLKYDFIVNPGGNPNQIALVFDGADELKIKKGKLIITTSVTEEKELAPYTFQPSSTGKKEVDCSYHLNRNILTFKLADYDKTKPLIIDPTKVFATFTGSTSDNWGFTATYDDAGNFYAGGIVFGNGFPVNNGSTFQGGFQDQAEGIYQTTGCDMAIIKFNAQGNTRLYATYIGGSNGNEKPHSLIVDNNNDLIILGKTSATNYPTTLANIGPCGNNDIVISKLNSLGNIVSSRKIGGSGDDGVNIKPNYSETPRGTLSLNRNYGDDARCDVLVDDSNNIIIGSCTQSTDFYTTANAFQSTNGSAASAMTRKQDAVFVKLSNDLSNIITSTYLGGNNDDAIFSLAINPVNHNIYIAGGTASNNFPGDTTNSIQHIFQGGDCDGFVSIFNPLTNQIIKSTYLGTNGSECIYGVKFDADGFPYILGTTTGSWLVYNAPFFQTNAKQFIAKLKSNLSGYIYSTIFGTNAAYPNISPAAFFVDKCKNVLVAGWGGTINTDRNYLNSGTTGMSTTSNAFKKITDGSDFYFFVLQHDAKSQLYGDFFGQNAGSGEHVDGGTSRFDANGTLYQSICANCGGPSSIFPTTPGAYSTTNGSSNCNLAALKLSFNFSTLGNDKINLNSNESHKIIPSTTSDKINMTASCQCQFQPSSYKIKAILPSSVSYINSNGGVLSGDTVIFNNIHFSDSYQTDSIYINVAATAAGCALDTIVNDNSDGNIVGGFANNTISGTNNWHINSQFYKSPTQAWQASNQAAATNLALTSNQFNPTNFSILSFWHQTDIESIYDGGVVELSTNNGASWQNAEPHFLQNKYNETLDASSPLANQKAFSGSTNNEFKKSTINLSNYAGSNLKVRFRLNTNNDNNGLGTMNGWVVDDIAVTNGCGAFVRFYIYDTTNVLLDSSLLPIFITPSPVPVKFVEFNATAIENFSLLKWIIAEQVNVENYVVERSVNGNIFESIASLQANANNSSAYLFYDKNPINGLNFYRIKAVDFNGAITYSNTRTVAFKNNKDGKILIIPNPSSITSKIYLPQNFKATQLKLYDALGKLIFTKQIDNVTGEFINFNTSIFAQGTYLINVLNNVGETLSDKLIITK